MYPQEMEEIISQIPNVKKCAVVNVPDKKLREVPKTYVVLKNDTEEAREKAKESIILSISERVSTRVVPKYFEFCDDLLYTQNGKIDFEGLRKKNL